MTPALPDPNKKKKVCVGFEPKILRSAVRSELKRPFGHRPIMAASSLKFIVQLKKTN
jgi:hypothetical protein